MKFYTYELIDPRNNNPFYIGKGVGNRMFVHERDVSKKKKMKNTKLYYKIAKILSLGLQIQYKQYFKESDVEAYSYEVVLIKKYREAGINLCNLTKGGEGNSRWQEFHTQATKDKISQANKGKPKSETHRKSLSKARLGKTPWNKGLTKDTSESLKKISEGKKGELNPQFGKKLSPETKRKISERSLGKTYIERFGEERAKEIGINISRSAKGKPKSQAHKEKLALYCGEKNNQARVYKINDNGKEYNEKTVLPILVKRFGFSKFVIRKMIKSGEFRNGISITL